MSSRDVLANDSDDACARKALTHSLAHAADLQIDASEREAMIRNTAYLRPELLATTNCCRIRRGRRSGPKLSVANVSLGEAYSLTLTFPQPIAHFGRIQIGQLDNGYGNGRVPSHRRDRAEDTHQIRIGTGLACPSCRKRRMRCDSAMTARAPPGRMVLIAVVIR